MAIPILPAIAAGAAAKPLLTATLGTMAAFQVPSIVRHFQGDASSEEQRLFALQAEIEALSGRPGSGPRPQSFFSAPSARSRSGGPVRGTHQFGRSFATDTVVPPLPSADRLEGQGRLRTELEGAGGILTGIPKGMAELVRRPHLLVTELPREVIKSIGRTVTAENMKRAANGEISFIEAAFEDLTNISIVGSALKLGAQAGSITARGAGATSTAEALTRVGNRLDSVARPLHTAAERTGTRAARALVGPEHAAQIPGRRTPMLDLLPDSVFTSGPGRAIGDFAMQRRLRGSGKQRQLRDERVTLEDGTSVLLPEAPIPSLVAATRREQAAGARWAEEAAKHNARVLDDLQPYVARNEILATQAINQALDMAETVASIRVVLQSVGAKATDDIIHRIINSAPEAALKNPGISATARKAAERFNKRKGKRRRLEDLPPSEMDVAIGHAISTEVRNQVRAQMASDFQRMGILVDLGPTSPAAVARQLQGEGVAAAETLLQPVRQLTPGVGPARSILQHPERLAPTPPQGYSRLTADQARTFGLDPSRAWAMPKGATRTIGRWDFTLNNETLKAMSTGMDQFRAQVLYYAPRWNFNNSVGNFIMAAMSEGTAGAISSFINGARIMGVGRKGSRAAPRELTGALLRELPQPQGRIANNIVTRAARNANSWMDDAFRVGIWDRRVRKQLKDAGLPSGKAAETHARILEKTRRGETLTGAELRVTENALREASKALVDYGNLNGIERHLVRQGVPFYTWQRGILQLALSLPGDHPLRIAVLAKIGQELGGFSMEERDTLPSWLWGATDIPGLGRVQTRNMNPFQDITSLIDPQRFTDNLSPFVQVAASIMGLGSRDDTIPIGKTEVGPTGRLIPAFDPIATVADPFRNLPLARLAKNLGMDPTGGRLLGPSQERLSSFYGDTPDPAATTALRSLSAFIGLRGVRDEEIERAQSLLGEQQLRMTRQNLSAEQRRIAMLLGMQLDEVRGKTGTGGGKAQSMFGTPSSTRVGRTAGGGRLLPSR